MSKSWLYTLFGMGRVPRGERAALEAEGVVLLEEGLTVSALLRNYRAPKVYAWWHWNWGAGSLVVTKQRLVAYALGRRMADIPLPLTTGGRTRVWIEKHRRLCVEFHAADLFPDRSGKVTLRYRTFDADHIEATILRPPPQRRVTR
ncbi:MAG: hypothetical protein HZB26_22470 [Candidatus Hydrogenedentes bacterium]|nr:hypothetical protein [Candidatus Hydrogenedentota bacterium]